MRIERVDVRAERVPLTRPYAIAFAATEVAELVFVRVDAVSDDGARRSIGLGCAAPVPEITGETFEHCAAAMEAARALHGTAAPVEHVAGRGVAQDEFLPAAWTRALDGFAPDAPAARAAVDMALYDLVARARGLPLADAMGRFHAGFPTSITIGIRDVADTLAEAHEYRARGFDVLKVKIGDDPDLDVERLARLRETFGPGIVLRVDANMGYDVGGLERLLARTRDLDLELIEQPVPPALDDELRRLPADVRRKLAADESLHRTADVQALVREPRPYGIWNVKLAKCGGIGPALAIARAADAYGVELMWGCMDESVVSIAAALHAACAARATRYLDLDGSFDLARDPARGGFTAERGFLRTIAQPGLGVETTTWT